MNIRNLVLACIAGGLTAASVAAQAPVLGSLEAPYPCIQSTVRIAGAAYGSGAVAYGPVGTPLVLTGSNLGTSGVVQFIGYKNGAVDPGTTVQATVTMWSSTMLFLTAPSGAVSGLVKVTVAGTTSVNGLPFIVTPGTYSGSCPVSPPGNQLQITTASLPNGTAGQSYSATLSASGGTRPDLWSLISGSLPSGLTLNASTGTISGTPTGATGPVDLTFQVTDSSLPFQSDEAVLSIAIGSQTLQPATIYTYSASYDAVSNVTQINDSVNGNWAMTSGSGSASGYDTLNRLSMATWTPVSGSAQYFCWSYDAFGNRTDQQVALGPFTNTPGSASCATTATIVSNEWAHYTTDGSAPTGSNDNGKNQVTGLPNWSWTQYPYDAAGNLTYDGTNFYAYDGDGRICAMQPFAGSTAFGYLYDADGNRVAKGTITRSSNPLTSPLSCDPTRNGFQFTESYVLGPSGEELTMLDGSNNWQRTNVYTGGKLIGTYDPVSNPNYNSSQPVSPANPQQIPWLHFHLEDPLGTRRMQISGMLANLGQPETDIQSEPFGDQMAISSDPNSNHLVDDATPLHFTGKERDSESGKDYFGARYYASNIGRFISPDWAEGPSAVPYASYSDPQSLNLYIYTRNNPLGGVDNDGHFTNGLLAPAPDLLPWACMDCQLYLLNRPAWAQKHPTFNKILLSLNPGGNCKNCLVGIVPFGIGPVSMLEGFDAAELEIANELVSQGNTVIRIPESTVPGVKTADALVNGVETEFKTVTASGETSVKNALERGAEKPGDVQILVNARQSNLSAAQVQDQIVRAQGNVGGLQGRVTVWTKEGIVKF